jgi:dihydrolipoamide dehydrogenase
MECPSVSEALTKAFLKKGIRVETNAKVEGIDQEKNGIQVRLGDGKTVKASMALVAVGRSLNTKGIGLETAGVLVKDNGMIEVNDKMETSVPGIYAVGDIASPWWLAHVASHQGLVAAMNAAGKQAFMHYNAIPSVIFTHPEIGTVGLSMEKAKELGYDAVLGAFPFQALGKSQATCQMEGFAQVVVDKKTGQILGAQVVGNEASSLIAEMALAIANELTLECIAETVHAHPTLPEAWLEAALIAGGIPLHYPPKRKGIA